MSYQSFRQKYPLFVFDRFSHHQTDKELHIDFHFSIPPDHFFVHKITFSFPEPISEISPRLEKQLIFQLGLSLIPSYWKLTCSPQIKISAGHLTSSQIAFWHKLIIKGMGEYFYKNNIDFTPPDFLTFDYSTPKSVEITSDPPVPSSDKVLVPVGGGKDSIVTLELLKPHFQVTPFVINPVPVIQNTINTAGLSKIIIVKNNLDPNLFELNQQGYLNGHTPISAFYTFASILAGTLSQNKYIAFSNEHSSNESNTTYLNHEINHQYSKSYEFESDLSKYLRDLNSPVSYFSFLRPLGELQITKIFSKFPKYFSIFSSCNQNFKLNTSHNNTKLWCQHCPKCVSTGLMLACFIGKDKVSQIMGAYPPDLEKNQVILNELTGDNPVKPFECVLTRAEAAATNEFNATGHSTAFDRLTSSWHNSPNLPEKFAQILKKSL